jgi:anthranilate synthase component 1/para-aminobenzoate synthetase
VGAARTTALTAGPEPRRLDAADAGALADLIVGAPPTLRGGRLAVIDGRAGAGKSRLAAAVQTLLAARGMRAQVVALDDLYPGWAGPTAPGFADDLFRWIADPLRRGRTVRHRVYDWTAGGYRGWRAVPAADVLLVEGVGAAHPVLRDLAAVSVWVEAPAQVRRVRAEARPGPAPASWWHDWAAVEDAYVAQFSPDTRCDVVITSAAPALPDRLAPRWPQIGPDTP